MDARTFDALARSFRETGSRRGLLGFFTTLPVLGGLAALVNEDEAAAKGRRKRHKKPHHHRKHTGNRAGKSKKQQKKCKAHSTAATCAGKCGQVKNNCQKPVDCGSCACDPPCDVCFLCNETTGICEPDPDIIGDDCDTCRVCDATGQCVAAENDTPCDDGNACTQVDTCQAGICIGGNPVVCQPLDQCHTAGVCNPDIGQCSNPEKPDGAACDDDDACTQTDTCQSGVCNGSNPVVCNSPNECQNGPGACDAGSGQCTYPAKDDGTRCGNKCLQACTNGICAAGNPVVCNDCQLPDTCNPNTGECAPDPAKQHTCDGPCQSGEWCDAGECAAIQATVTLPDCHSLCNGSTDVCGQTVTCPGCNLCRSQTGCLESRFIPDGPVGPGEYCATTAFQDGVIPCTTNSNCPSGRYCGEFSADDLCVAVCPF